MSLKSFETVKKSRAARAASCLHTKVEMATFHTEVMQLLAARPLWLCPRSTHPTRGRETRDARRGTRDAGPHTHTGRRRTNTDRPRDRLQCPRLHSHRPGRGTRDTARGTRRTGRDARKHTSSRGHTRERKHVTIGQSLRGRERAL